MSLLVLLDISANFDTIDHSIVLRSYLDVGTLTTLVHVLVVLRLDYCNALYMGLLLRLMQKLQMVQNMAARLFTGVKRHQDSSPTLVALHWLPIHFRIVFKALKMI